MKKSYLYNKKNKGRSRYLRKTQTDAEKLLWYRIRGRQLFSFKFRRQFPIDSYILDFYCKELNLAIELDGSYHMRSKQVIYDRERDTNLRIIGVSVLRFYDNDIFKNLEGVLTTISEWIKTSPHPGRA